MNVSKNWNRPHAVILGALVGATYALVMCDLANLLLSIRSANIVVLALIIGAVIGASTLSCIASLLNYAKAVTRS